MRLLVADLGSTVSFAFDACLYWISACVKMTTSQQNWTQNAEIQIFQEYLRIRTDHPDVDYSKWHFIHQIYSSV